MKTNRNTINKIVIDAIFAIKADGEHHFVARLRYSNAVVWETEHFYLLQSYATLVAAIDKETNIMFDFLRYVYGYTPTSAQHIAKFATDYGATRRYTYRP